ncbi:MAG: hypothetical protein GF331_17115 [Chitinivibrionales bacterium]|nr:hypothetical protein [Chitinivibrionales bacterium]
MVMVKPRMRECITAVLCLAFASGGEAADGVGNLSRGLEYLGAGDIRGARPLLQQAFEADSSDPRIRLAYASVTRDARQVEDLLRSVAHDTSAASSQRAHALASLGGMHYLREEYADAARLYTESFEHSGRSEDAIRAGLAELHNGHAGKARTLFRQVAEKVSDGSVLYYLSLLAFSERDYTQALAGFKSSIDNAPKSAWWRGPSTAGCALSAERLGYLNLASRYRREHEQQFGTSLERTLFERGFAPLPGARDESFAAAVQPQPKKAPRPAVPAPASTAQAKPPKQDDQESYTIQLGSFGSRENAEKLRDKMSADLDNVRIVPAEVNGTVYYRVRVGAFDDRDSAEAYAGRHITHTGVSHKVLVNR